MMPKQIADRLIEKRDRLRVEIGFLEHELECLRKTCVHEFDENSCCKICRYEQPINESDGLWN